MFLSPLLTKKKKNASYTRVFTANFCSIDFMPIFRTEGKMAHIGAKKTPVFYSQF